MSKYTTEVRFICENAAGEIHSEGYNRIENIIQKAAPKIFDFSYPIFDPDYKPTLERKILRHFYTREICEETVGLWKLRLCDKLNMIMPYYNQLYHSALIEFDPLIDTDLSRRSDKLNRGNEDFSETQGNTSEDTAFSSHSEKDTRAQNDATQETSFNGEQNKHTENITGASAQINNEHNKATENAENDSVQSAVKLGQATDKNSTVSGVQNRSTGNSTDLYSATPQGSLSGVDSGTYLTDARKINTGNNSDVINSEFGNRENKTNEINNTSNKSSSDTTTNADKSAVATANEQRQNLVTEGKNASSFVAGTADTQEENNADYSDLNRHSSASDSNRSGNRANAGVENYMEKIIGRSSASPSARIIEFRQTFINIDAQIIEELNELFFNLW